MAIDTTAPRTRRALLTAALGAGIASVATAIGRPLPVRAAGDDGTALVLGGLYADVQSQTTIANKATDDVVLYVASNPDIGHGGGIAVWGFSAKNEAVKGQSTNGRGVVGTSGGGIGVYGTSTSLQGVRGESSTSIGVYGTSESGTAIHGTSQGPTGVQGEGVTRGMHGFSASGTGVVGTSGGGITAPAKTGVYGYAAQDTASRGVGGFSPSGRGVYGETDDGYGVRGSAMTGTAGHFATSSPMTGTALRTVGRVRFDKSIGIATINGGNMNVIISPGIDLTAASAVVATLQGSAGGTTTVHRCTVNPTANTITIHLTKAATQAVKVAWHVFG